MAIYNEILVGRYARMLQKLFGIKGTTPVKQLAGELTTTFNVFSGAENRYLESWNVYGQTADVPGVAAVNSAARLRNPAGSNVIGVLFAAWATNRSAADRLILRYGPVTTDLTSTFINPPFDSRGSFANSTLAFTGGTNAAAFGTALERVQSAAAQTLDFLVTDWEIPILPGQGVQLETVTVNSNFVGGMFWRERFLEDSERT